MNMSFFRLCGPCSVGRIGAILYYGLLKVMYPGIIIIISIVLWRLCGPKAAVCIKLCEGCVACTVITIIIVLWGLVWQSCGCLL